MQESCLNDLRLHTGRYPCAICDKLIRSNGRKLKCSLCNFCYHFNCTSLTLADYKYFKSSSFGWTCQTCSQSTFPFHSIEDNELVKLSHNSNLSCLCSKNSVNVILEDLPVLQTMSNIGNIPHLSNFDPKSNTASKLNFNYFDIHKFHSSPEINICSNKAFSLLNCNIRSTQANFDNPVQLLSDLNFPFNIISTSETWLRSSEQIANFDLPGYSFLSQATTLRAGGVGLYIKNGIQYSVRHDLSFSTDESEMLWVEIESDLNSNMICSVVYRHPSSNLETFLNNVCSVIGKISRERKLCLISGDFNINLLNYDKHPLTEDFVNTFSSFFLEPQILRPTRITSHSSTLIDNIFFNSIEYQTVSGNLLHDLTDHLPNFLIIERFAFSMHKEKRYKRDYSNYNEEAFLNEFSSTDWSDLLHGLSDTTEMFDKFYVKVSNVINSHLPSLERNLNFKQSPGLPGD